MRRMPLRFYIGMPETRQRLSILKIILEGENVDDDIDLDTIAEVTPSFSGSDLKVCFMLVDYMLLGRRLTSKRGQTRLQDV